MSFFWPKINKNQLFTPTLLLFSTFLVYFFASQDFANKNFQYSYLLSVAGIVFCLKSFILSFSQIENYQSKKRPFLVTLNLIFFIAQLILILVGVNYLSFEAFPIFTIQYFILATIIFLVQAFLAKSSNLVRVFLSSFLIYGVSFLALERKWLVIQNTEFILMQEAIGYSILFLEIWYLFKFSREFLDKKIDKN